MTAAPDLDVHGSQPPDTPEMSEPPAGARPYVAAWLGLLLLTAASFGVDQLAIGRLTLPATLSIAVLKALLVLWFFMHLRGAPFGVRLIAALNLGWVLMICLGIAADVAAR